MTTLPPPCGGCKFGYCKHDANATRGDARHCWRFCVFRRRLRRLFVQFKICLCPMHFRPRSAILSGEGTGAVLLPAGAAPALTEALHDAVEASALRGRLATTETTPLVLFPIALAVGMRAEHAS
jgi:hypothetical protein